MKINWARIDSFVGNSSSPALTFHRPCPICGSIRSRVVMELNDFQFYSDSVELPKRVSLRENQCLDDFALYLNPCYSNFAFQVLFAEAEQSYGAKEGNIDEQIEWLSGRGLLRPQKQVLDAGCYDGLFLARLPNDVKKTGVDIDEQAIERGRRQFGAQGIEFVLGDFESYQYAGAPDTITMFHVLEHLPRPVAVLRKLRSVAHPATHLVVEVPILENGITNDINGFLTVQHMTHFSRRSLQNCLAQAGWRIVEWYERSNYNGCRVLAEPCEETSAVVGNSQDTNSLNKYLSAWYQALLAVDLTLVSLADVSQCVIWGAGTHTEFLYHTTSFFTAKRDREYVIVDSDPLKQGNTWRGIPIHDPSVLTEVPLSRIPLLISSYGSQESIPQSAIRLGVSAQNIIKLYKQLRVY